MALSKFLLNYITILLVAFLYTGYNFLQVDQSTGISAVTRTYNSIIGLIVLISMVVYIIVNRKKVTHKKSVVLGFVVAWIVLIIFQTVLTSDGLERILITFYYVTIWPVSYVFFYYLSTASSSINNDICSRLFFLAVISLLLYYLTAQSSFSQLGNHGSIGASYYLLCFLPWVIIVKNRNFRYVLLALFIFSILVSSKRTSIIGAGLFMFLYIVTATRKKNLIIRLLLICFVFFMIMYLFYYVNQNVMGGHITDRFSNFERGADTRNEIRELTLLLYYKSSLFEQIVGHGYNSVIVSNPLSYSAHNDYVETLYDHGLVLFILQIIIILRLFYMAFKLWKMKDCYYPAFLSSVVLYVVMAYTTHLILYPYYFCFLTAFWGYIEGQYVKKLRIITEYNRQS